jgi:pilus assembly protein CpaE
MIVDDSSETREVLKMLLAFAGGVEVVAEAANGVEALQQLSIHIPDIVFMDVNMPVMDGVAATEEIHARFPDVTVIMLSVQNDIEYVRRCLRAGAKGYLFKPVPLEELRSSIQQVQKQLST